MMRTQASVVQDNRFVTKPSRTHACAPTSWEFDRELQRSARDILTGCLMNALPEAERVVSSDLVREYEDIFIKVDTPQEPFRVPISRGTFTHIC